MNVLLAESDVPYEKLLEMEDANGEMANTDVSIIIGANDLLIRLQDMIKTVRYTECRYLMLINQLT
jgi:hypothetical protein